MPRKTRHIRNELSYKPILPALAEIIAASPCGDLEFLVTDYGRPFTPAGLGGKMREWCNEAGLPHCSAHGLPVMTPFRPECPLFSVGACFEWNPPMAHELNPRFAK